MASEPTHIPTDTTITRTTSSAPLGEITSSRPPLGQAPPVSSIHLLPTNTTPVSDNADEMPPTNVHARPAPRPGAVRKPDAPWDFLPNTQNVIRGGFPRFVKTTPPSDPDKMYLAPHFPPKGNSFYELTSDGRLSDLYFENARLRRFRTNPDLSILSAGLSPAPDKQNEKTVPESSAQAQKDRVYIGQCNWRQANEILSPVQEKEKLYRHKHTQPPTHFRTRLWQPSEQQTFLTNEELWKARGRIFGAYYEPRGDQQCSELDCDLVAAYLDDSELSEQEKFQLLRFCTRHSSKRNEAEGQDQAKFTTREPLVGEKNRTVKTNPSPQVVSSGFQVPNGIHTPGERKDQFLSSNTQNTRRKADTEKFPPSVPCLTNTPGDRSGENSRLGRTRMDLESSFFPVPADGFPEVLNDVSLNPIYMPDFD